VTWTAVASPGSNCTPGGTGNIEDTIDLLVGGTVTYTATGTLAWEATGTPTNQAIVAVPPGYDDPTPKNNTASDTDSILIPHGAGGSGIYSGGGQDLHSSMDWSPAMALGDIDGDGDVDAFLGSWGSQAGCTVWLNTGEGHFHDSGQALGDSASFGLALADLDGDGDLDAFVANAVRHYEWFESVPNKVWLNDGQGHFTDSGQTLGDQASFAVALGDVDGDGDPDALVGGFASNDELWLNDGQGVFSDSGQNLGDSMGGDVALGDLDGDGDLDAYVAGAWYTWDNVWLNDGRGIFTDSGQLLALTSSKDVALGDLDGDGDLDALVANEYDANKVWLNQPGQLVGQQIFYNESAFDGNDPGPDGRGDRAIATDKQALLPGQTATSANYTSYSRGINGVMVDISGLVERTELSAADFEFRVGNDDDPSGWSAAPAPKNVAVRQAAGTNGSDRLTITWLDNTIQNTWLQVTVLATANTALPEPQVFYFGNAIGETGNSATDARVDVIDALLARNNLRTLTNPASIDFPYDFNRDQRVNATDMLIARNNQTHLMNALELISAPDEASEHKESGIASSVARLYLDESSAAVDQPSASDAILERADTESQISATSELDWLYEFEQMNLRTRQPRNDSYKVEDAVDKLLETRLW